MREAGAAGAAPLAGVAIELEEDDDAPSAELAAFALERPLGEPDRAAGRCLTPAGLGAARRLELRARDSPGYMRFLRQSTMAATKRMPRNSMARFHLALILHRLGDLTRAHVEFQRALECAKSWLVMYMTGETIRENPRTQAFCARITAHVVRVAIEMQGDRFSSAQTVDAFGEAFRWDANAPHIWNDLALMHLQAGECDAARVVLESVVARWPDYIDALSNLAVALLGVGQSDAAVRCLQAVIASSRSHVEALNNYATVLIEEQREPRLAVAMLRAALQWDATQPAVWSNLAVACSRIGMRTEACAALSRACELAPEWETIWLNAASLLSRMPDAVAAASSATPAAAAAAAAAAAGPQPRETRADPAGAGEPGAAQNVAESAAEAARAAVDETPCASSAAARSRSCLRREEIEARVEAQAELLPDARAWAAIAATRMRRWELGAASVPTATRQELRDDCLKASAKALSIDEGNVVAWMHLGLCALHDGLYAKAQGYFLQVLTEQPRLVSGWCNLGMALHLGGQGDEALKAYMRGLELHPDSAQLQNNLGNLYRQRRSWVKAEETYLCAIRAQPSMALAYNNLALLYVQTGHVARARAQFARALELDPTLECALSNMHKLDKLASLPDGALQCGLAGQQPFDTWLFALNVPIPTVAVPLLGGTVDVRDATCTEFVLGAVEVAPLEGERGVRLSLANIHATCAGSYSVTGFITASGTLAASLADSVSLAVELRWGFGGSLGMLDGISATGCSVALALDELRVTGIGVDLLTNLLIRALLPALGEAFSPAVCDAIERVLFGEVLPAALAVAARALEPLLGDQPPGAQLSPQAPPAGAFDWGADGVARRAFGLLNRMLVARELDLNALTRALFARPEEDADLIEGNSTAEVAIVDLIPSFLLLPVGIEVDAAVVGRVGVEARTARVRGLDTVVAARLLPAALDERARARIGAHANSSFVLELDLRELVVELSASLSFETPDLAPACEQLAVRLAIAQPAIYAVVQLPVVEARLNRLAADQLVDRDALSRALGCALGALDANSTAPLVLDASFASFDVEFSAPSSSPAVLLGALGAIGTTVRSLEEPLRTPLAAIVSNALGGPAREHLTRALQSALADAQLAHTCEARAPTSRPPAPEMSPAALDWGSDLSGAVGAVTAALNEALDAEQNGVRTLARAVVGAGATFNVIPEAIEPIALTLPVLDLTRVLINVSGVTLGGFDTVEQLALLAGSLISHGVSTVNISDALIAPSLALTAAMERMLVSCNLSLALEAPPALLGNVAAVGAPVELWLLRDARMDIELRNLTFSLALHLPAEAARLANVSAGQLFAGGDASRAALGCLLAAVDWPAVGVAGVAASFGAVSAATLHMPTTDARSQAVWDALAVAINELLPLFLQASATALAALGQAAAELHAVPSLDAAIDGAVGRLLAATRAQNGGEAAMDGEQALVGCVSPPPPSAPPVSPLDEYIDWSAVAPLIGLAGALGETSTIALLNELSPSVLRVHGEPAQQLAFDWQLASWFGRARPAPVLRANVRLTAAAVSGLNTLRALRLVPAALEPELPLLSGVSKEALATAWYVSASLAELNVSLTLALNVSASGDGVAELLALGGPLRVLVSARNVSTSVALAVPVLSARLANASLVLARAAAQGSLSAAVACLVGSILEPTSIALLVAEVVGLGLAHVDISLDRRSSTPAPARELAALFSAALERTGAAALGALQPYADGLIRSLLAPTSPLLARLSSALASLVPLAIDVTHGGECAGLLGVDVPLSSAPARKPRDAEGALGSAQLEQLARLLRRVDALPSLATEWARRILAPSRANGHATAAWPDLSAVVLLAAAPLPLGMGNVSIALANATVHGLLPVHRLLPLVPMRGRAREAGGGDGDAWTLVGWKELQLELGLTMRVDMPTSKSRWRARDDASSSEMASFEVALLASVGLRVPSVNVSTSVLRLNQTVARALTVEDIADEAWRGACVSALMAGAVQLVGWELDGSLTHAHVGARLLVAQQTADPSHADAEPGPRHGVGEVLPPAGPQDGGGATWTLATPVVELALAAANGALAELAAADARAGGWLVPSLSRWLLELDTAHDAAANRALQRALSGMTASLGAGGDGTAAECPALALPARSRARRLQEQARQPLFIDWAQSDLLDGLRFLLHDVLQADGISALLGAALAQGGDDESGPAAAWGQQIESGLPRAAGEGVSAVRLGELLSLDLDLGAEFGRLRVRLDELTIANIDSLRAVELFKPSLLGTVEGGQEAPALLDNTVRIGGSGARALRGSLRVSMALEGMGADLHASLDVSLSLVALDAAAEQVDARVDVRRLFSLGLEELLGATARLALDTSTATRSDRQSNGETTAAHADVERLQACLLATASEGGVRIGKLRAEPDIARLRIDRFTSAGVAARNGSGLDLAPLADALRASDETVTRLLRDALGYALPELLLPQLNEAIAHALARAAARCARERAPQFGSKSARTDEPGARWGLLIGTVVVSSCIVCAPCFLLALYVARARRAARKAAAAAGGASESGQQLARRRAHGPSAHVSWLLERGRGACSRACCRDGGAGAGEPGASDGGDGADEGIGEAARAWASHSLAAQAGRATGVGVAAATVLCAALFVWANAEGGASVLLLVTTPFGLELAPPPLLRMTLQSTVDDMWRSGAYPLAVIIAFFSGGWPYIKLSLLLLAWLAPPHRLPPRRRGQLLTLLHDCGKWSIVDVSVLQLLAVAFRFELALPAHWLGGLSAAKLDVYVRPERGLYNLAAANVIENLVSHAALIVHRVLQLRARARGAAAENVRPAAGQSAPVESLLRAAALEGRRKRTLALIAIGAVPISAALTVLGARAEIVRFRFEGLARAVLSEDQRVRSMSLLDVGAALPGAIFVSGASSAVELAGTRFVTALFWIFHLAMPLALAPMLAALWLLPLSLRTQRALYTAASMANAWSALDVFVLAVIAAVSEMEHFVAFVLRGRCDTLDALVAEYLLPLVEGDARCFGVTATLGAGCWISFAAVGVSLASGSFALSRAAAALDRRQQLADAARV